MLVILCVRNESQRLPHFLEYYRERGVAHFLAVDNASTDGTAELLAGAPDTSVWQSTASYRDARFGLDWTSWLLMRYGRGHWCLTVDADELLTYAHDDRCSLPELTAWLDQNGQGAFGALMLDLYPKGPLGAAFDGGNPLDHLEYFDPGPYRHQRQHPMRNLWVQGGARDRAFFAGRPEAAPTLNKIPLVRWRRPYAYVNSTHALLPSWLNLAYDGPGGAQPSGALLHTKFLPEVVDKAAEDLGRRQHFHDPDAYAGYYEAIEARPTLWHEGSRRFEGWRQLADLGLLSPGGFD